MKLFKIILVLLLFNHFVLAQNSANDDCLNAIKLCPNTSVSGDNLNANADNGLPTSLCFTPSNGVWYSFKALNSGNATIQLSNISSFSSNNELQAALISFSSNCILSTATILDCNIGTTNSTMNLSANGLSPNQTYYLLIDGGDLLSPPIGTFSFDIKDTGTAVKPAVNIQKVNATCNMNNGKISLKNIRLNNHPYTFQLNGGVAQTDSTFDNLASGAYSIVISDASGCSFTINQNITNNGITSIQTSSTNADCSNNQKGSINLIVLPANNNYNYSLDGGTSQVGHSFTNVDAGTHFVTITGINCDTTVLVIVPMVGGVTSAIGQGTQIHCGASNGTITYPNPVLPNPPALGSQYIFKNLTTNQQNSSGVFHNLLPGIYQIQVFNSNSPNCIYTDLVTISQLPGPKIDTTKNSNVICGDATGKIIINASGGVLPYQYSVDGVNFLATNTFGDLNKGSFQVIIKDANGCSATYNTVINETAPGVFKDCSVSESQTILEGDKAIVTLKVPPDAVITWFPETASKSLTDYEYKLFPTRNTEYIMTATLPNGCVCSNSVQINVKKTIDIPDTFTPNGDGKNDTFLINNIENYRNVEITIYDRWGNRIYHTTNYTPETAWDGSSNGGKLPVSVYYYVIKFEFPEDSKNDSPYYYEGSISLLK